MTAPKRLTRCRKCGRCKETQITAVMAHVKLRGRGARTRWGSEDCGPFDVYVLVLKRAGKRS